MSSVKLKDRVQSYLDVVDTKILPKLPIIITINGRSFNHKTEFTNKPFDLKFSECMISTMLHLCGEIDGAVLGYQFSDEIVIIIRNDQNQETLPWCDNRVQKICSLASSISSIFFAKASDSIDLPISNAIFYSQVFGVPNLSEAINVLISKQQQNFHLSANYACLYELMKAGYNKYQIKEMLSGLSVGDKIDLLEQETEIKFNEYINAFRRGTVCYKSPKMYGDVVKYKWQADNNTPIFTKDQSFLSNIIK